MGAASTPHSPGTSTPQSSPLDSLTQAGVGQAHQFMGASSQSPGMFGGTGGAMPVIQGGGMQPQGGYQFGNSQPQGGMQNGPTGYNFGISPSMGGMGGMGGWGSNGGTGSMGASVPSQAMQGTPLPSQPTQPAVNGGYTPPAAAPGMVYTPPQNSGFANGANNSNALQNIMAHPGYMSAGRPVNRYAEGGIISLRVKK